ncbi:MAG: hypothetical protein Q7K26_06570 [bacterium]|nr:hypothetical protein [bacterium]
MKINLTLPLSPKPVLNQSIKLMISALTLAVTIANPTISFAQTKAATPQIIKGVDGKADKLMWGKIKVDEDYSLRIVKTLTGKSGVAIVLYRYDAGVSCANAYRIAWTSLSAERKNDQVKKLDVGNCNEKFKLSDLEDELRIDWPAFTNTNESGSTKLKLAFFRAWPDGEGAKGDVEKTNSSVKGE